MYTRVHVLLDPETAEKAWYHGLNISGVCRKAIREMVEKLEEPKETPVASRQTNTGATRPMEGINDLNH